MGSQYFHFEIGLFTTMILGTVLPESIFWIVVTEAFYVFPTTQVGSPAGFACILRLNLPPFTLKAGNTVHYVFLLAVTPLASLPFAG